MTNWKSAGGRVPPLDDFSRSLFLSPLLLYILRCMRLSSAKQNRYKVKLGFKLPASAKLSLLPVPAFPPPLLFSIYTPNYQCPQDFHLPNFKNFLFLFRSLALDLWPLLNLTPLSSLSPSPMVSPFYYFVILSIFNKNRCLEMESGCL